MNKKSILKMFLFGGLAGIAVYYAMKNQKKYAEVTRPAADEDDFEELSPKEENLKENSDTTTATGDLRKHVKTTVDKVTKSVSSFGDRMYKQFKPQIDWCVIHAGEIAAVGTVVGTGLEIISGLSALRNASAERKAITSLEKAAQNLSNQSFEVTVPQDKEFKDFVTKYMSQIDDRLENIDNVVSFIEYEMNQNVAA